MPFQNVLKNSRFSPGDHNRITDVPQIDDAFFAAPHDHGTRSKLPRVDAGREFKWVLDACTVRSLRPNGCGEYLLPVECQPVPEVRKG